MAQNNFILAAKDIHKSYRMGLVSLKVLKGVDFSAKKGEFVAIVGASGSGKSTLLHILGGLDRPDKGTVYFENNSIKTFSGRALNSYRNKSVGFVFQFYHLLDELNVLENVLLPAMASCGTIGWWKIRKSARTRGKELLEQLGLSHRVQHKPYQLSGGERQRAAIARALINDPPLFLADEPTGNLDSATGNGILEALSALNRSGQTIVMVTHDDRIAARAHRTVTLTDGKIVG